ncbi:MAG: VOC family protein [Woeseiaceae bacterium]|nr:VOC family protein [Woeseiaceae bacterium]
MIGYTTVGSNDLEAAAKFYDELFGSIGIGRLFETETFVAWGSSMKAPGFSVCKPYNKEPASVGNGVMIAIALDSPQKVDAFHAKALELGGTDEGAPGDRGNNFYAAYFRDLDGNKLNGFCMKA